VTLGFDLPLCDKSARFYSLTETSCANATLPIRSLARRKPERAKRVLVLDQNDELERMARRDHSVSQNANDGFRE
jgi:hypothetical protein